MNNEILTRDLIDPKKLRIILLTIFGAFSIWVLIIGIQQYIAINHFLSKQEFSSQSKTTEKSLEVGSIVLTRAHFQHTSKSAKASQGKTYASVLNLDHKTPAAQKELILSNHNIEKQPMYGLAGAPSFVIKPADVSFWRSQLYLETLIYFGGLFIISLIFIVVYEFRYREDKLFISPVKNSILAVGFLLMAGVFIKWGLNYRLVHFLNSEFYISHLEAPYPSSLLYIATPIMILGIWLDQAVRLQKEQDLTI